MIRVLIIELIIQNRKKRIPGFVDEKRKNDFLLIFYREKLLEKLAIATGDEEEQDELRRVINNMWAGIAARYNVNQIELFNIADSIDQLVISNENEDEVEHFLENEINRINDFIDNDAREIINTIDS